MKASCLFLAFLVFALSTSLGEIRNGYAADISNVRTSLITLRTMLGQKGITSAQRRKVMTSIREVTNYLVCYELTENLLVQFKLVAGDIYREIDTIKDRLGRSTDVYVKFIPEDQATIMARGITNVARLEEDHDAYISEYGAYSVSVKVWIAANALEVLAHEFGHVKHQVPNLRSYLNYYEQIYSRAIANSICIGHDGNDESGWNADTFARMFRQRLYNYRKNGSSQFQSPLFLMEQIRRMIQLETSSTERVTLL